MVPYHRRVFINCPFDNDYPPLLQAIAFAVIDCGFSPLLDAAAHQHQRTMSDVAGLDPKVHGKDPRKAIDAVRHFLASLTTVEILSFDYLSDLIEIMVDWTNARP